VVGLADDPFAFHALHQRGGAVPDLGCGAGCGNGTGSAMTGDAVAINPDNTNAINAAWLKPVMSCSAKRLPQIR